MCKRGENIYKRKDKRWEGRYIKGIKSDGKLQFGYIYAKSYKEAKEKLIEYKQLVETKSVVQIKQLGCFCDEWLTVSRNRVKESTYIKYKNIVNSHLKPCLGQYLPQDLSTVIVEAFSNSLLLKGLSSKTVKDVLVILRSVLKYCRSQSSEEFKEIEIIYPKENKREMRVLTHDEQKNLIKYLMQDMDTVKFGTLLAMFTGMRIGEICALKWQDISLEEQTVSVSKTMQRLQTASGDKKTEIFIGDTKSESSTRIIPMSNQVAFLCRKFYTDNENAYVLTGDATRFIEPRTLQYRIKKYASECGIKDLHFHTLRHTFATRCVEVGFEIKSLSEVLGHSSTKVTLDRYVHSSIELKRVNMEKLSAVGF